jgi:hypothetical protein
MYFNGVCVAFILSFLIFTYQGILRKKEGGDETFFYTFAGTILGALVASIFSWLMVFMLVVMTLKKKTYGINDQKQE